MDSVPPRRVHQLCIPLSKDSRAGCQRIDSAMETKTVAVLGLVNLYP